MKDRISARAPRRLSSEELRESAVALLRGAFRRIYSVELANATGVRLSRASHALRSLERVGVLESKVEWLVESKSGLGRRYYRLKEDA